jgi:hypothetical protein
LTYLRNFLKIESSQITSMFADGGAYHREVVRYLTNNLRTIKERFSDRKKMDTERLLIE